MLKYVFLFLVILCAQLVSAQNPVITARPRVMLNSTIKTALIAKKNANHPDWIALKNDADEFSTWPVASPWNNPNNQIYRNDEINYYYQGSRWVEVTMPLALAYQLTADTKYSNKLKQLADVIIGAGDAPIKIGAGYPSRNIGRAAAIIYDWCYDALSQTQREGLVTVMKQYYKFLRFDDPNGGAYQNYENATGNYYWGNPDAAAFMGYAIAGDDGIAGDPAVSAGEMIAWARYRYDGTVINNLPNAFKAFDHVKQTFEGGYPTLAGRGTNAAADKGNPHKGGVHVQGWSYGSDVFSQYIDYVQLVKSATNEDLFAPVQQRWYDMLKAQKHSLLPNGYHIDEMGDNGTNYGIRIRKALPLRLAFILQGTTEGAHAASFLQTELLTGPEWDDEPVEPESWERLFYGVTQTPSAFVQPPFYSGFNSGHNLGQGNGAMPYFLMRDKWGTDGTWISFQAASSTIDDHDHFNAGNIDINFKGQYILSSPSESNYAEHSAASNTFYLNDRGAFQSSDSRRVGGQSLYGRNQVTAANQTDSMTYVRAILTTAYNKSPNDLNNAPAARKLNYFVRSFVYLRRSNVVIVYDQTSVQSPPSGAPYNRHIRWHFANGATSPVVSGNTIKAETATSSLNIHTVMPEDATVTLVNQSNNPDAAGFGENYYFNTNTWRAEVAGNLATNNQNYLSVLQPGVRENIPMQTLSMKSVDGNLMEGTLIITQGGARKDIVFFNKSDGELLLPIATVTLPVLGQGLVHYTVTGVEPGETYSATVNTEGTQLTLQKVLSGAITSDVAGVVRFMVSGNQPVDPEPVTDTEDDADATVQIFPNPSSGKFRIDTGVEVRHITVMDAYGRITPHTSTENEFEIDAKHGGIYFIRLVTPNAILVKKLVID